MRKLLALVLSLALVTACAAALAETETPKEGDLCTYTIYNETGEKVVELYLIDNNDGEKSENFAGEEGLEPQAEAEIQGAYYEGYVVSLYFRTESGYEATFATLHHETVPISLLPAPQPAEGEQTDATTGATPISFSAPTRMAQYLFRNKTGENVTSLALVDNSDGETIDLLALGGTEALADGETTSFALPVAADKTKDVEITVKFTTESGYEGTFPTLHFESVTINLLEVDAASGATSISFEMNP